MTRLPPAQELDALAHAATAHSADAKLTEYFDVIRGRNGDVLLMVTSIVDDPKYLRQPFIVSTQFKKQPDAKGWDPTPCSATW